ncbi:MAG TPA: sulfatase [Acidobacteriota bacterium]|nr:sulfatase [Acidobacteriota bacterium]
MTLRLASASCLTALLLLPGCSPTPETNEQAAAPNIIFFVTDDQRFDMMGNVNPLLHTPQMDRLAAEGVRLENAFVTTPICAASRASLLTGTLERTHQFTFGTPPLARALTDQSYAALLRVAGYHTGFIGKFGMVVEPGAADAMFDAFVPLTANPYFKVQEDGSTRHLTDVMGDEAIAFLRASPPDQPFALSVSFNAPHAEDYDERQYIWPTAMDGLYTETVIPDPPLSDPAFLDALPAFLKDPEINMNRFRWFWRFDTPDKAKRMTKGYFRMISGVDAVLGRIRDELEQRGLADNTLLILMGDNGYFLGERGYAGKWLPHEPSIRVPLLAFDPRPGSFRAGLRPTAMALNIDIAPTLLDLAGVEVPATMQGRSLVPLLRDEEPDDWRTDFFVEHLMENKQIVKHEGVRGQRYKYARYFELDPVVEELYDLESDPLEIRNLVADPAHAEVLAALRSRCDELRDRYGGPYARDPDLVARR